MQLYCVTTLQNLVILGNTVAALMGVPEIDALGSDPVLGMGVWLTAR